jgi:outer membrane protein assembly factor BamB
VKNCSGGVCDPLWTANTGSVYDATPTVANGEVFIRSTNFTLFAFDAAGVVHCRGVPKTCKALWTSATRDVLTSAAVANGVLYVGSSDGLDAYDEAGVTNCTGRPSPKRCAPLWTGQAGGPPVSDPAVANGVAYVGTPVGAIYAFDADGVVNCSFGVCDPLWRGTTDGTYVESPIVVNGMVYTTATDGKLYAFSLS